MPRGAGGASMTIETTSKAPVRSHTTSELLAKRPQLLGKGIEVGVNKVIVDLAEAVEPKSRELIEDRAFFRDGIG